MNDDVTNMPVIGTLRTKVLDFEVLGTASSKNNKYQMPAETYHIVEIYEHNGKKFYITNIWYKEHKRVPLIISEDIVDYYIPTEFCNTSRK
jgi:hypothetical protein